MNRLLILLLILASCTPSSQQSSSDSTSTDSAGETLAFIDTIISEPSPCDILYDTITNPAYRYHKSIMDCYTIPGKREYWFSANNDTLESYLHAQHIGVWMQELDSTEQGIYRTLTNKIVFLMLQHDSRQLGVIDFHKSINYDYFLWHAEHPMCNEISIDSTIACVKRYMDDDAKEMKQRVVASLEVAKSK